MNSSVSVMHRLGQLRFLSRCAIYLATMLLTWLSVAILAQAFAGADGVWAASVAAGICLASGILAIGLTALLRGPSLALYAMLVGMLVRMALPLLVGGALQLQGGALAEAGLLLYLTAFYLVTLTMDTVLMVAQIRVTQPCVSPRSSSPATVKAS